MIEFGLGILIFIGVLFAFISIVFVLALVITLIEDKNYKPVVNGILLIGWGLYCFTIIYWIIRLFDYLGF